MAPGAGVEPTYDHQHSQHMSSLVFWRVATLGEFKPLCQWRRYRPAPGFGYATGIEPATYGTTIRRSTN